MRKLRINRAIHRYGGRIIKMDMRLKNQCCGEPDRTGQEREIKPNKNWLYTVCRDADASVFLTIYDGDVSASIALPPEMAEQMARAITGRDL